MLYAEKVSISLPPTLMQFVEEYKVSHDCKSRSQVIEDALKLLHERELEIAYKAANVEASVADQTSKAFASTASDGLPHEAW